MDSFSDGASSGGASNTTVGTEKAAGEAGSVSAAEADGAVASFCAEAEPEDLVESERWRPLVREPDPLFAESL